MFASFKLTAAGSVPDFNRVPYSRRNEQNKSFFRRTCFTIFYNITDCREKSSRRQPQSPVRKGEERAATLSPCWTESDFRVFNPGLFAVEMEDSAPIRFLSRINTEKGIYACLVLVFNSPEQQKICRRYNRYIRYNR